MGQGSALVSLCAAGVPARRAVEFVPDKFDPAGLDPYIAGLEVVGQFLPLEQEVVADAASGRVYLLDMYDPRYAEVHPLAPSIPSLHRLVSAVADFDGRCGRFADLAGRAGPGAVREARERLVSVLGGEPWGAQDWGAAGGPDQWPLGLPNLWRIMAVVKPLALIAAPGRGLLLDLPARVLADVFGPDGLRRFAPGELPSALVHEPTRRFLTEVGLPKEAPSFSAAGAPDTPLRTLAEDHAESARDPELRHLYEDIDDRPPVADADQWLYLGNTPQDVDVVLDGRTGAVHHAPYTYDRLTPMNADVSTLSFALWMHGVEQEVVERYDLKGSTDDFYVHLAEIMLAALATVDPDACRESDDLDEYVYWPEVFHDAAGGVL
ncbi:SUKH-4 family immunity protein [Streptomyces sp. NPDC057694]|uniref:SUKH-4 family immunity protein n=1 Tax=Streptomyces sp. NPDC057694 TaxID=3346216 RepID=UPI0036BB7800